VAAACGTANYLRQIGCVRLEQPELEHPRGVEPVDSQRRTRGRRHGAAGHEADELGADHFCASGRRLALDRGEHVMQRGRFPVLDVHAHLHEACARQLETEGTHAWESAVALADRRGGLPRRLELSAQVDVERDQRSSRSDEYGARTLLDARRPELGRELAGLDASTQPLEALSAEERRPAAGRELAVDEYGQLEL